MDTPDGGAVMLPWNQFSPPHLKLWLPRIQLMLALKAGRSVFVCVCSCALPICCMPPRPAAEPVGTIVVNVGKLKETRHPGRLMQLQSNVFPLWVSGASSMKVMSEYPEPRCSRKLDDMMRS